MRCATLRRFQQLVGDHVYDVLRKMLPSIPRPIASRRRLAIGKFDNIRCTVHGGWTFTWRLDVHMAANCSWRAFEFAAVMIRSVDRSSAKV